CELLTLGKRRAAKGACHLVLADLLGGGEGLLMAVVPPRGLGPVAQEVGECRRALRAAFPSHVHLALTRHYGPGDERRLARLAALAASCDVPAIAVGDVLYHCPARRPLQDVLTCIREHETLRSIGTRLEPNAERHLRGPEEVRRLFRGYGAAVTAAVRLFSRIAFSLEELRYQYPDDPLFEELGGERLSSQEALRRLVAIGEKRRWPGGTPEKSRNALAHELE
ncbi:MAG: error-prone DNA polymerase, partial [Candidatus Eisenbacteria bacterium]|nr:error-prone DNA polymerase [Candidatus Eisenbacteria bacterium]